MLASTSLDWWWPGLPREFLWRVALSLIAFECKESFRLNISECQILQLTATTLMPKRCAMARDVQCLAGNALLLAVSEVFDGAQMLCAVRH